MKINRIIPDQHEYLQIIGGIANKPKALYYIGRLPEQRLPTVAIVGTRKPSSYGKEVAHRIAFDLAKRGVVIVSGLALGIDSIAHRAALEAGGITLAVLGNSVDLIYPRNHVDLAREITKTGAILSEYEPPVAPRDYRFLERNRIVSGLADVVAVVEAASRSGTLNTASHALEQGRELFAVPGNITSPLSAGCNALIRQGAHPLISSQDILDILLPKNQSRQQSLPLGDTALEVEILQLLGQGERDGDIIQQKTAATPADFSHTLTMLEIKGYIRALGANNWTIK